MRPLRLIEPGPARVGGARVWVRERENAKDSLSVASALLGEPLTRDANGRPRRAAGDVSIAHAGGLWAMAAVERGCVGIDIEPLRERPNALEIVRAQFPPREAEWLAALPPARCSEAFLRLWCAREAVLKAIGTGMAGGFAQVEFDLHRGCLTTPGWRLFSLSFKERAGVRMVFALARSRGEAKTLLTQPSPGPRLRAGVRQAANLRFANGLPHP